MDFEEFKKEAFSLLRQNLRAHPKNEVDKYIDSFNKDALIV